MTIFFAYAIKAHNFKDFLLNKFSSKIYFNNHSISKWSRRDIFELLFQYEGERNSPLLGSAELTRHSFCESNKDSPVLLKGTSLNSYSPTNIWIRRWAYIPQRAWIMLSFHFFLKRGLEFLLVIERTYLHENYIRSFFGNN